MFKVLIYYSAYDTVTHIVSQMKKIGIDVDSHQSPNKVLSQTIEFNADFVVFETGANAAEIYAISAKLQHLITPPKIVLIKKEEEVLSSNKVMQANIAKVISEPLDAEALIAYLLEEKGFDPVEYFSKYLKTDYKPKKGITPKVKEEKGLEIDPKFAKRDYSKSYNHILDDVEPSETLVLAGAKIDEFKKKAQTAEIDLNVETDLDHFRKALLEASAESD